MLRNRGGFTLIEAAVAMAIVAVIAIGALGALAAQLRADAKASEALPAAALARERLATLLVADAGELARLPDSLVSGSFAATLDAYAWKAQSTAEADRAVTCPPLLGHSFRQSGGGVG